MSERTVSIEAIRIGYAMGTSEPWTLERAEQLGIFDRSLAAAIGKARREGVREGHETARQEMISGAFIGGPTYEALKKSFSGVRIATETLYEAANEFAIIPHPYEGGVTGWLRERADRIAAGDQS